MNPINTSKKFKYFNCPLIGSATKKYSATRALFRLVNQIQTLFNISLHPQSHIRTHDSMTLESYHTDFILTNKRADLNWMEKAIHSNVIHTCQICHTNVAWNSDDLTSHLQSHGYTSDKYKAEFMAAYRFNSEATLHMTDDSNWSDQNKFECKVEGCSEKLTSRVRLVLHIQKV